MLWRQTVLVHTTPFPINWIPINTLVWLNSQKFIEVTALSNNIYCPHMETKSWTSFEEHHFIWPKSWLNQIITKLQEILKTLWFCGSQIFINQDLFLLFFSIWYPYFERFYPWVWFPLVYKINPNNSGIVIHMGRFLEIFLASVWEPMILCVLIILMKELSLPDFCLPKIIELV